MDWPIVGSRWFVRHHQKWLFGEVVGKTLTGKVRLDFSACGVGGYQTSCYEEKSFRNGRLWLVNEDVFLCFIGRPA